MPGNDPIETLNSFLSQMGFIYTYNPETKVFLFDAKVMRDGGKEDVYPVAIVIIRDWVLVVIAVLDLKDAPSHLSREKILEGVLVANFNWPEVNYGLSGNILVSLAWSHKDALSLQNFKVEFAEALNGAKDFGLIVKYASSIVRPPKQFSPVYQ